MSRADKPPFRYASGVAHTLRATSPDCTTALFERFGPALTLEREGNRVRWTYAESSAVVELRSGSVAATFVAAPSPDVASARDVRAVYAPQNVGYFLTERGVASMVDDVAAFFSGVREPRFRFVDTAAVERNAR